MSTTATPPVPLINWHALGQVLGISFVLGVGLVVLFTVAVHSVSMYRRRGATVVVKSVSAVLGAAAWATIAIVIVWGFYLIIHK
jgi:hypothetical protein